MSDENWIRPDLPSKCTWTLNTDQKSPHNMMKREHQYPICYPSVLEAVGFTPMVHLKNISNIYGIQCNFYAKCEYLNPFGSVKDRIGYRMVVEAEAQGILKPGCTLIEPTSGNTGIGIAAAAAVKGYRCIIVIPEKMSDEKINVLRALGAEIHRTPTAAAFDHPDSNIRVAQKLKDQIKDSVILDQYRNPYNPIAHYDSTAEEIIDQCGGKLDSVVIGAGTGGTITGISRRIKEKLPLCQIVGVDPIGSSLALPAELNVNEGKFYEVEGIGYDFIPTVLDRQHVDSWIKVDDKQGLLKARELISKEALLVGASSGSVLYAGIEVAKKMSKDQTCVIVLPDSVRNYMTKFLSDDWMIERGFLPSRIKELYAPSMADTVNHLQFQQFKFITMTDSLKNALDLLKKHCFRIPIPVLDGGEFQGCIDTSFVEKLIEGMVDDLGAPVSKFLNRACKKAFLGETTIATMFYLFKNSQTVFLISKSTIEDRTTFTYIGQLTKTDFYHQIFEMYSDIEVSSKLLDRIHIN